MATITEEQKKDIEFVKEFLLTDIDNSVKLMEELRPHLPREVIVSTVYLKIFAAWLVQHEFTDLEDTWKFMREDAKGIIEKVFYVNNYVFRVKENLEKNKGKK